MGTLTTLTGIHLEISQQIYRALEILGAESDLLSIIGSYGDTLSDDEILDMLKDWNVGRPVIHTVQ